MIITKDKDIIAKYLYHLSCLERFSHTNNEITIRNDQGKALAFAIAYIKDRENIKSY